ncbi:MAG TPA: hypothetical protein VK805_20165 [Candidatus Baltobacteraceae bacterium]|nr:hypothetical protein [Candidatus Baltobacteraceae bacterium]
MPHLGAAERRRKGRLRVPRVVRVRPSEPTSTDFDEVLPTKNAALDSVYFISKNPRYKEGLRLFITFPYSDAPGAINRNPSAKLFASRNSTTAAVASPFKS